MTRTSSKISSGDQYLQLVGAFPLRRIRSAAEHAAALKVYLRLSSGRPVKDVRDYLDVLADLIADYEKRTEQSVDTSGLSAAAIVRHRLDERGMSVSELARQAKISQPNLSDMLRGRRGWSKTAIVAIGKLLNIRASVFCGEGRICDFEWVRCDGIKCRVGFCRCLQHLWQSRGLWGGAGGGNGGL